MEKLIEITKECSLKIKKIKHLSNLLAKMSVSDHQFYLLLLNKLLWYNNTVKSSNSFDK
jgi:hypothetical protein